MQLCLILEKCRSGGNSLIISVKLVMIMKHANVR